MNKNLAQLVELSKIDIEIDSFLPQIENAKKESTLLEEKITSLKNKNEKLNEQIAKEKEAKTKANNQISSFSVKLSELANKYKAVKTEKELNAIKLDEELARENLEAANNEIAKLEKIIETKNEEIKTNESEIKKLEDDLILAINNQKDSLNSIEEKRKESYIKKDTLAKEIDSKLFSFYEKIRKWAKNTAVVPVKKQACYGCFMKLNSTTYNSILKGNEINTCSHCGRILYIEE